MRSIRLSLMLYFLVLLAVALGAVSVWAYRHTQSILGEKVQIQAKYLRNEFMAARDREVHRFDRVLIDSARFLARQTHIQFQSGAEIQFHEDSLPLSMDTPYATEYFQINSENGRIYWRSSAMGDRFFPFDLEKARNAPWFIPHFDSPILSQPAEEFIGASTAGLLGCTQGRGILLAVATLSRGSSSPTVLVRRVTLKASATRVPGWPGRRGFRLERLPGAPPPGAARLENARRFVPPLPEGRDRPGPAFYIQCAAETTKLDAEVAKLGKKLDTDLAKLDEDRRQTLATLRNRLLLIGLATFAATLVGGVWLVQVGLSPLHRLSLAVSSVSAKDFKLPFDEPRLPRELRPIVERLTKTLELLKRTFAREKQAAADISHELRTPLAALLTTTEVALRKPRSAEEYRELLADCHATGQQMSQLIERLLALARLDAGVDTLRPREVDASSVAEQCATLVRPLVAARGLTLRVERNGPVVLQTDPDKLREILTNLLHNAIEYNRPAGSIELALARQNGHVLLEVRDTGIGIAPAAREQIFERFYRADPSRQADGLHAGLGLAIVKGYVDLMGGKISVQSTEGQGTTFRVELPASGER
jgi:heavy metal sensor kinase